VGVNFGLGSINFSEFLSSNFLNFDIAPDKIQTLPSRRFFDRMKKNLSMEDKKTATILIKLLEKHTLDAEEKEAVLAAIGILSWTSLSKSKIKAQKAKRDKSTEW
jgi:hypothetical protein